MLTPPNCATYNARLTSCGRAQLVRLAIKQFVRIGNWTWVLQDT